MRWEKNPLFSMHYFFPPPKSFFSASFLLKKFLPAFFHPFSMLFLCSCVHIFHMCVWMCEWVKQQAAGEKVDDVGGWVTDERGNKKNLSENFRVFYFFTHKRELDGPCKKIERGWGGIRSLSLILFFHVKENVSRVYILMGGRW